ncbi:ATP-binding cassette subfamily B protein [Cryobacterium sp. MP_M5]|uniref:ABC transporter ATP-binding protein n=1 Tax=unclassified Cryobacterium TaxID=2649013 RepID=UPI0018CAAE0F|nr:MULTISPECIES: ABC transporter ATP-binding protein [unclassified Cryobacterium]MBG6058453.1 ATP-binding cassette subfamily B protein [Cryobacterium sp. MP_M3]MEC5176895.1 ATP-binding cassette subfamily B protein [Cryobacterium sp. MP_M5]
MGDPSRTNAIEQGVVKTEPFRSFLRLLRPYRGRLSLSTLAFLVKDSPAWVLPPLTAAIIDIVVARGPLPSLWSLAGLATVLLTLNYPFHMLYVRGSSRATRSMAVDVRNALTERLQRLSIGFHNRQSASIVQTKVVRDVENLELMMQQAFPTVLSTVFTLTGAIVITAIAVPAFVGVFAITVPVAALLVRYIRTRAGARNENFRLEVERFSAGVGEMAALIPITRGHGLELVASKRVAGQARSVSVAGQELDTLNGRFGAFSWVSYQVLGVACLVGASAASITQLIPISPGQVVLLSTYFTVLTGGIVNLLNVTPVVSRGLESMRSIAEIMEEPDVEVNDGRDLVASVSGAVELDGVSFRYLGGRPALTDISLSIRAGETIALVGPSGSGKSTLLNLVLGFVRPTTGRVLLDGHDMSTLDMRSVRSHVSIVPQESVLFEGTIRDNVAYGLTGVDDERILSALRGANALDILGPADSQGGAGLDAIVGTRGSGLSGGQRQRLAIARALVRDPRILILDEPTSALDADSEGRVKDALATLFRDRTTLIAAHRLSTIREADRIAYIEKGRIVELGSHDELMALGNRYARIVSRQTT